MAPPKRGSTHSVSSFAVLLSVCLSLYLFVCLSVYVTLCFSVYLSLYVPMSLCMSVYLSVCLCVCRSSDQQRNTCDGTERAARWQEAQRSDSQVADSLVTSPELILSSLSLLLYLVFALLYYNQLYFPTDRRQI